MHVSGETLPSFRVPDDRILRICDLESKILRSCVSKDQGHMEEYLRVRPLSVVVMVTCISTSLPQTPRYATGYHGRSTMRPASCASTDTERGAKLTHLVEAWSSPAARMELDHKPSGNELPDSYSAVKQRMMLQIQKAPFQADCIPGVSM